jgi:dihydrofolate reductase
MNTCISLIVAIDGQNGIGKQNELLCHLPADLAYFKAQTMGKPMIMGRRTFDSIGKALPGRRSIVLTSQLIRCQGVISAHSVAEAIEQCGDVPEIMVIGGSQVYQQFLPLADRIYVTNIHHTFDADVYFPSIDSQEWMYKKLTEKMRDEKNAYAMTFGIYQRQMDKK